RGQTAGPTGFRRTHAVFEGAGLDGLRDAAVRAAVAAGADLARLIGRNRHRAVFVVRRELTLTDHVAERIRVVVGLRVAGVVVGRAVLGAAVRQRGVVAHVAAVEGRAL